MSAPVSRVGEAEGKRAQVLDAAQACFVRHGFHRASMNDIAREAAMSAANLYRYFDSKEALIVGLAERESRRGAALVAELRRGGDARARLLGIVDRYFLAITREEAVMRVEIWAEASRNAAIAAVVTASEAAGEAWFTQAYAELASSPDCAPAELHAALAPFLKGVVVAIATLPGYDPAPAGRRFRALLDAGLAGQLPGGPW